jgi:hypothetical protein
MGRVGRRRRDEDEEDEDEEDEDREVPLRKETTRIISGAA